MVVDLSYSPHAYVVWRAGTTTHDARVDFICPDRDYEFGYSALALYT
jgi:hypothetical protein